LVIESHWERRLADDAPLDWRTRSGVDRVMLGVSYGRTVVATAKLLDAAVPEE
jgi:hypothetical protein